MGKQIKVVVGANFGDEGKGLMTDYFCHELSKSGDVLNVKHNGGAQAGHTVVTPDGKRHVFHHFGAGSFNPHVATYLSKDFILNPILFCKELDALKKQFGMYPKVYIDKACRITIPYDMLINQIAERARGDSRHGSCGVGINETVQRYRTMVFGYPQDKILSAEKILNNPLDLILFDIRKRYVPHRLEELGVTNLTLKEFELISSDVIIYKWIDQLEEMLNSCMLVDSGVLNSYDGLVFEGAQGLLLDNDYKAFAPHLTTSKTGSYNPKNLLLDAGLENENIEVCYVSRSYFTRHGAGPFLSECDKGVLLGDEISDKTNHNNEFQGEFRYGYFDIELFTTACRDDASYLANRFATLRNTIAVTHLDETDGRVLLSKDEFCDPTSFVPFPAPHIYQCMGETRTTIEQIYG